MNNDLVEYPLKPYSIIIDRGDTLRVKQEFDLDAAQYTEKGKKLWALRVTLGEGCELVVLHRSDDHIICRALEHHNDKVSAYITLQYDLEDIIWDRVEIIKKKD